METKRFILLNANEPPPELEDEYNRWYDEDYIPSKVFKHPAVLEVSRYRFLEGMQTKVKGNYARYLTIYSFEDEESFRTFEYSYELIEAKKCATQKWKGTEFRVTFRAQYKPVRSWVGIAKARAGTIEVIGITVPSKAIYEFNSWHDEAYVPILLFNPSLLGVTRYELVTGIANPDHPFIKADEEKYPKCLTIYNFENPKSFQEYENSTEILAANDELQRSWKRGIITVILRAQYKLLITAIR